MPKRVRHDNKNMIFHIDLDAFFASIEQRDNPALRGKAIAIGSALKYRGIIATASYEARKYGLTSGMSAVKARELCPHLILISPNFSKYTQASHMFYAILSSYTPYIE